MTTPSTLVLLDPTAADGETALELIERTDTHIILVVLLSGPASRSLRDFARAEDTDMATAGWRYLEQVVERLALAPDQVLAMTAIGPSAAMALADIAAANDIHRILVPGCTERYEPGLPAMVGRCTEATIVVAGQAHSAAFAHSAA